MQASWRTPMPAQSLQQNPCYGTDREVEVDSRRRGVPRQAVTRDGHPDRVARGGPSRAHLVARAHRRQEGPRRRAVPVPVRADPRVAVDEDLAEPRARCPARRAADAEQERRRRVRPPPPTPRRRRAPRAPCRSPCPAPPPTRPPPRAAARRAPAAHFRSSWPRATSPGQPPSHTERAGDVLLPGRLPARRCDLALTRGGASIFGLRGLQRKKMGRNSNK